MSVVICPMQKNVLVVGFLLCSMVANARHYTWPASVRNIQLAPANLAGRDIILEAGDTLYIPAGKYAQLGMRKLHGAPGKPIVIIFKDSCIFTTPQNLFDNYIGDCSFIQFRHLRAVDYKSNFHRFVSEVHDIAWIDCQWRKNLSGYLFEMQDKSKVFDGSKASTYYNFRWENCLVEDLRDGAFIRAINSAQPGSLSNVCLNFVFVRCTFDRFVSSGLPSVPLNFDFAFALVIDRCRFSNIGVVEKPVGHGAAITFWGYAFISNNLFGENNFADDVRCSPIQLKLEGYFGANAEVRCWNNISREKRKYGMFEINQSPGIQIVPVSGGRLMLAKTQIWNNTLYRSRKADYVAPLVDAYASDITIGNNLVIEPEIDDKFVTASADKYIVHYGTGGLERITLIGNRSFAKLNQAGVRTSSDLSPLPGSNLINNLSSSPVWITTDINGRKKGRTIGALETIKVSVKAKR